MPENEGMRFGILLALCILPRDNDLSVTDCVGDSSPKRGARIQTEPLPSPSGEGGLREAQDGRGRHPYSLLPTPYSL